MKNTITLSFIFSLMLMLAPAQSDAQFGDLIKKGKKQAKKALKQKSSKNKEPKKSKQHKRNEDSDIAVISSNGNSEEASSNQYKRRTNGTYKMNELEGEEKLRAEAYRFLSDLSSLINSLYASRFAIRSVVPITDAHASYFVKDNYEDQAHEKTLLQRIESQWLERGNELTETEYLNIDLIYQGKGGSNESKYYNSKGDFLLGLNAKTLHILSEYILPENQNLKDLAKYAATREKQLKAKLDEELDEISINDVHKANLNKVLFTNNKNINPQTAPASAYKTVFAPGEEIYAVAMLDKGINEKLVRNYDPEYKFQIGKHPLNQIYWVEHETITVKDNQQYFVFPLVIKASNFKCSKTISTPQIERSMEHLSTYGPRKHTFTLLLNDNGALHNAQGKLIGDFTIDGTQGDMTVYQKMANDIRDKCPRD